LPAPASHDEIGDDNHPHLCEDRATRTGKVLNAPHIGPHDDEGRSSNRPYGGAYSAAGGLYVRDVLGPVVMKTDSDESLMARYAATNDRAAFDELFRRYVGPLTALFSRTGCNDTEAHDLVQQTFLQLHHARKDFRADARLRPWLYAIAMNVGRAAVRKEARKLEQPGDLDAYAESSAPHMRDVIRDQTVQRALKQLSHDQREVIVLHWFEGLDFQEIANIVDASLSAVKVRAHRGYERLRALLGGIQ
jgi:RNA polymerase sigma factor (sigma-70 family)